MYTIRYRVWLERSGRFIAGEGRAALLREIGKRKSLSSAASALGISYRHAWEMLKKMGLAAGSPVAESSSGGSRHGETRLTPLGEEILRAYEDGVRRLKRSSGPWLTVDAIVETSKGLLLVRRRHPPFQGRYALPGGFVECGETVEEAVVREVREETGLRTRVTGLVGVYSDPSRDPRGHTVSVVFSLRITGGSLKGSDDASEAAFFDIWRLPELAFDHSRVVHDYLHQWRVGRRGRRV
ncbi:MAG: NUDIX domain-containing protein [Thermoplasmata archaeon]